jgi:putative FmdB family regulatory protein
MPLYEYQCETCLRRFERIQKFSDPLIEICPTCGAKVHKLVSSPAIQFKGSGWYITDYARKSESSSAGADEKKPAVSASGGDAASKDAAAEKASRAKEISSGRESAPERGQEGSSKEDSTSSKDSTSSASTPSTSKDSASAAPAKPSKSE